MMYSHQSSYSLFYFQLLYISVVVYAPALALQQGKYDCYAPTHYIHLNILCYSDWNRNIYFSGHHFHRSDHLLVFSKYQLSQFKHHPECK
jgi:hypothetical protein